MSQLVASDVIHLRLGDTLARLVVGDVPGDGVTHGPSAARSSFGEA